jgi:hypothetical protein
VIVLVNQQIVPYSLPSDMMLNKGHFVQKNLTDAFLDQFLPYLVF